MSLGGALLAAAGLIGCATPPGSKKGILDDDPAVRIRAIKAAGEHHNIAAVKDLVTELSDEDPAVRFYAIRALKQITGEDMKYCYYQEQHQRKEAVERWRAWLKAQQDPAAATTRQATVE